MIRQSISALLLSIPLAGNAFWPSPVLAAPPPGQAVIKSCATIVAQDGMVPAPTGKPHTSAKMSAPLRVMPGPNGMPIGMQPYAPAGTAGVNSANSDAKDDAKTGLNVHQSGKKVSRELQKASEFYLSNDDSMSLASAQRLIYAIQNFLPIYQDEIRPHEFLNYFHFKSAPLDSGKHFSVYPQTGQFEDKTSLTMSVQGQKLSREQRKPAVLTLVVDKSGSMAAQGKMDYLKAGLTELKTQLKAGDVINLVEFDNETCNAIEGFVVGRDDWKGYDKSVQELGPRGSTDLHAGLVQGYQLAEKFRDPAKINRVLLITDAIANTGELSEDLMASIGKYYDTQKIALSGIGVGLDFNDELLDTLTDRGKGAYLFLGMKDAVPRVFGSDFVSLLETTARNVQFKIKLPSNLHLNTFYGEEVSTDKTKVQPIHYFANTGQLFLLDLDGKAALADALALQIEFENPNGGPAQSETFSYRWEDIQKNGQENFFKARLIMEFAKLLEETALPGSRPYNNWNHKPGELTKNKDAKKQCQLRTERMRQYAARFSDAEVQEVLQLGQKYCARF